MCIEQGSGTCFVGVHVERYEVGVHPGYSGRGLIVDLYAKPADVFFAIDIPAGRNIFIKSGLDSYDIT